MKQVEISFAGKLLSRIALCAILVTICLAVADNRQTAFASNPPNSFFGFAGDSFRTVKQSRFKNGKTDLISFIRPFLGGSKSENNSFLFLPENPPTRVLMRHGIGLNGRIEGSVQQLLGESTTFNSAAVLTGDLLVPGSPNLIRNGVSNFGGTVVGSGSALPNNYSVTLNSNALLGHLLTRTDPIQMPTVSAPPPPTGTRSVTINNSTQSIGDFATLRNLTLNSNVGSKAIPPGTYGSFIVNSGSGLILGTAGSSQPTVYNFSALTLNSTSQVQIVGPVVITLGSGLTINGGVFGAAGNAGWAEVRIAVGGVTLNTGSVLYAKVVAPAGTVTINSRLEGNVTADRLSINSGGVLKVVAPPTGDTTAPVLNVTQPANGMVTSAGAVTVTGSYVDESQTSVTVNGQAATVTGNSFSAVVNLTEGSNAINISAVDAFGNTSQLNKNIIRDTTAPVISLQQPSESYTNATEISVAGSINDATATTVTVNNTVVPVNNNSFNFPASLPIEGTNTFIVHAVDAAGNTNEITRSIIRDTIAPQLSLTYPTEGEFAKTLRVLGTTADASPVSVEVSGQPLAIAQGGNFSGDLEIAEGTQTVRITAQDAAGNQTRIDRSVNIDLSPPVISNISPSNETIVDSPATISGRITDFSTVAVKINGISAVVTDGNFTANNVSLSEGDNEVTIVATDAVNNESTETLILKGRDRTAPAAPVLFQINSPTKLAFQTIEGKAEPGSTVNITGGVAPATTQAAFGTGIFVANVNLNVGVNNLTVIASDAENNSSPATQAAITSNPNLELPPAGLPSQINISSGNSQKGLAGSELPRPLITIITDQNGNTVQNVPVTFTVQAGGGQFINGSTSVEVQTDALGRAAVRYISGTTTGIQQIRADFNNNLITPAVFLCESLAAQQNVVTSVAGSVLDQNLRALPNVIVRIGGQQTRTGNDGRFVINNVPAGPHQLLELIGRDQINLPGRWTNITYDFDVLPGIENQIGRPLFLPRVNDGINLPLNQNGIVTQDTTYELPVVGGESPIKVTAKTGTHVIFPADVIDKRLSVTRIATNRVPMTLEDGRATNLYISVQPSGAVFETPLEISFPNLDRLPANSEVSLMSFDHDAGRYVQVGTGHVSADGRDVKSDAGSGIRVGAWHALPPPKPQPEATVLGYIQISGNPNFENKTITNLDAWVEGTRAVATPNVEDLADATRVELRATVALSDGGLKSAAIEAQTTTVKINFSAPEIFTSINGTKDLTATIDPATTGPGTFTWDSGDKISVTPTTGQGTQSTVTVKGVKKGEAKLKVQYINQANPKVKVKAEIKVFVGTVKYEKTKDCAGFDDKTKDSSGNTIFWLVVPENGTNNVAKVNFDPDASATKSTFVATNTSIATVTPATGTTDNQVLTVAGVTKGVTDVTTKIDGSDAEKLNVTVKAKKVVRISFHFVADSDSHGAVNHHTNRRGTQTQEDALADSIITRLNAIWTPQANVVFEKRLVRDVQVATDLGSDGVTTPANSLSAEWTAVTATGDSSADWNIFWVWELSVGGASNANGGTETGGKNTLYEDNGGSDVGESLAHEAGHKFGIGGSTQTGNFEGDYKDLKRIDELMFWETDTRGCFIRKGQADVANP
jgi:hypothetical protein